MELKTRVLEEWIEISLDELGVFIKGKGISRSEANSGTIPCVRYGEIYTQHHDVIRKFYSFISRDIAMETVRLKEGDILFTCSGETKEEIGKSVAFTVSLEAYAGGDIIILRNSSADAAFLGYRLNARDVVLQKSSAGQGDAVVHINATALGNIQVTLPRDIAEQKAIAAALSDVDALLDSLDALIAKKRDMKKAAMQELLTGKTRLPGFGGEWVEKTVDDLAELSNERILPCNTPKCELCVELEHIVPREGKLCGHTKASLVSSTKAAFEAENILFGRLRAYLKKFWFADRSGACSTEIWVLKARKERVSPKLFYYLIQTQNFIDASSVTYGTHMPRSEWSTVKDVTFMIPENLEEQQTIANVLSDMDAEIEALEARYAKVKDMKTGMMQELLTGKTRLVPTGE